MSRKRSAKAMIKRMGQHKATLSKVSYAADAKQTKALPGVHLGGLFVGWTEPEGCWIKRATLRPDR